MTIVKPITITLYGSDNEIAERLEEKLNKIEKELKVKFISMTFIRHGTVINPYPTDISDLELTTMNFLATFRK